MEVGIVLIVLMVWAGAIALFFNRWGKIRMLLPYQPDYKHEQLKVPGTGVCTGSGCNGQHSHQVRHLVVACNYKTCPLPLYNLYKYPSSFYQVFFLFSFKTTTKFTKKTFKLIKKILSLSYRIYTQIC